MAEEKRLRKRNAKQSESDTLTLHEEPPRKKSKRTAPIDASKPSNRSRRDSKPSPKGSRTLRRHEEVPRSPIESSRGRRKLLVSLNIHKNDLQVSGSAGAEGETKSNGRSKGRGKSRQGSQQRAQSVGSDAGSVSNGNGNSGQTLTFKNPKFTFSSAGPNKKKIWKNLKQILTAEKALGVSPDAPTYSSIDAPPSLKPAKKYSDLSGFIAKYTDPLTGIYFSTTEEFQILRTLPQDVVQGYLALRGKMTIT